MALQTVSSSLLTLSGLVPALRIMLGQWGDVWESGQSPTRASCSQTGLHCLGNPTSGFQFFTKLFDCVLCMSACGLHLHYSPPAPSGDVFLPKKFQAIIQKDLKTNVCTGHFSSTSQINSLSCSLDEQYFCGKTIL